MGGIRFKLDPDGLFLSDDKETATPPWTKLRTLEEASRNFENDEKGITDEWLEVPFLSDVLIEMVIEEYTLPRQ